MRGARLWSDLAVYDLAVIQVGVCFRVAAGFSASLHLHPQRQTGGRALKGAGGGGRHLEQPPSEGSD